MLKNYIKILHTNLSIELENYKNMPFYLAIPYIRSKEGSCVTLNNLVTLRYIKMLDKEFYAANPPDDKEPSFKQYRFVNNPYGVRRSTFHVIDSQFYIGTKYNLGHFKRYVYSRNEKLRRLVGNLVEAYDKTPEGIPDYLVFVYLNFYRDRQIHVHNSDKGIESLLRFDKQTKTLKRKYNLSIGKKYQTIPNDNIMKMYDNSGFWSYVKFNLPTEEVWSKVSLEPYPYIRYTDADDGTIIRTCVSGGTQTPWPPEGYLD